jgi:hypothetical protein
MLICIWPVQRVDQHHSAGDRQPGIDVGELADAVPVDQGEEATSDPAV